MTMGGFVQLKTRRGFWRAEVGEAWVGKGPAHFRYFVVLKAQWHTPGTLNLEILVFIS